MWGREARERSAEVAEQEGFRRWLNRRRSAEVAETQEGGVALFALTLIDTLAYGLFLGIGVAACITGSWVTIEAVDEPAAEVLALALVPIGFFGVVGGMIGAGWLSLAEPGPKRTVGVAAIGTALLATVCIWMAWLAFFNQAPPPSDTYPFPYR